jgi:hypothetical protein
LENKQSLVAASHKRWSEVQPLLVADGAAELVALLAAKAHLKLAESSDVAFCQAQRLRPEEALDPPPLLDGQDLISLGIPRGPIFAKLLRAVRAAQLDGEIANRNDAIALAQQLAT